MGAVVASTLFLGIVTPPNLMTSDVTTNQGSYKTRDRTPMTQTVTPVSTTSVESLKELHLLNERVKELSGFKIQHELSLAEERRLNALLQERNLALKDQMEGMIAGTDSSQLEQKVAELERIKTEKEDLVHQLSSKVHRLEDAATRHGDDISELRILRSELENLQSELEQESDVVGRLNKELKNLQAESEQGKLIKKENEQLKRERANLQGQESDVVARLNKELKEEIQKREQEEQRISELKRELVKAKNSAIVPAGNDSVRPAHRFVVPTAIHRIYHDLDELVRTKISPRGLTLAWGLDVMVGMTIYTILIMVVYAIYKLFTKSQ